MTFEATVGRTPGQPIPDDRGTVLLRAAGLARRFRLELEVRHGAATVQGFTVEVRWVDLGGFDEGRRKDVCDSVNVLCSFSLKYVTL